MKKNLKPWEIVTKVLLELKKAAVVGVSLIELDRMGEEMIRSYGGVPINKGYHPPQSAVPYPNSIVISLNDEIAHGIADGRILKDGDLVSIDLGVAKDGLCGDAALTVGIGELHKNDQKLLTVAKAALYEGISIIRPGLRVCDIGWKIQTFVKHQGFVVNHYFCGHQIGKEMHERPAILHFYDPRQFNTDFLEVGQMICIEPMVTKRDEFGIMQTNGWTRKTKDGKKSAMFEHQILITKDGYEILTDHI